MSDYLGGYDISTEQGRADYENDYGAPPPDSSSADNSMRSDATSNRLLDFINGFTNAATNVYSTVNPPKPAKPTKPAATKPVDWQKYLPWIIGAVALVVLLGFLAPRRR